MKANRFFSVPYDNRNDIKMKLVRKLLGGYAGYGRWVALLGILYDQHGRIDVGNQMWRDAIADDLDLDDVDEFFAILADIGLIDAELYHSMNIVANNGVCEQLDYMKQKSEAGKKGNEKRWNSKANRTSESH